MNDLFATIYETWFNLFNPKFDLIFAALYYDGGYVEFGLLFILLPLLLFLLFYYVWKYPYGKFWHWSLWLLITTVIVSGLTYSIANSEIFASENKDLIKALNDPNSGFEQLAKTLIPKYALANGILTIGVGFIYSLILKQFSKIQIHLPF